MTWTPTESDKRAEKLMLELKDAAEACGVQTVASLYPMYHARVFDLISKALDQALNDGAEQDALDKVVGNGHFEHKAYGVAPDAPDGEIRVLAPGEYLTDPVIEAHEEGPGAPLPPLPPLVFSDGTVAQVSIPDPEPKKKRGRPKGSKAKKAKVAKGQKAKDAVENGADPNVVPFSGELHAGQTETEPEPTIDLVQ